MTFSYRQKRVLYVKMHSSSQRNSDSIGICIAKVEEIGKIPFFKDVSVDDATWIQSVCRTHTVGAKIDILRHDRDNNQVIFLLSGKVCVRGHGAGGTEVTLGIFGQGEMFGDLSILNGCRPSADVRTIEESRLLVVSREEFLTCLNRVAPTALNLLRLQAARLRRLTSYATSIATMDADMRIVLQLLALASEYGKHAEEQEKILKERITATPVKCSRRNGKNNLRPVTICLKLTQNDLASLCGCSVKQVYRTIAALQEQHLISVQKGSKITLQDPERLRYRYLSSLYEVTCHE